MTTYKEFHDGALEGLLIEGSLAHVWVSTMGKDRFVIVTKGIAALSAGGFRSGNIIFDVQTRTCEELTLDDVAELYDLMPNDASQEQATKLLKAAREQKFVLLEINPSYGGACMILARSVDLLPQKEWVGVWLKSAIDAK